MTGMYPALDGESTTPRPPVNGHRWLSVPDTQDLYWVSDQGLVWSAPRGRFAGGIMKPYSDSVGYLATSVSIHGKHRTVRVHVLVAKAFHGPRPPRGMVRHLNGQPLDNRAVNLIWGTGRENALDRRRHGTQYQLLKTRCKRGHLLAGRNLRLRKDRPGHRQCAACTTAHYWVKQHPEMDLETVAAKYYAQYLPNEEAA